MFNLNKFRQDILEAINQYRLQHCADLLQLSESLTEVAQVWVEFLVSIGRTQYCLHTPFGQTLYEGTILSGEELVRRIYGQSDKFSFDSMQLTPDTNDFTQLVWKGSSELGVGAQLRGDELYVVLFYNPKGNQPKKLWKNVSRNTCENIM